jgi:hypothetical protein
VGQLTTRGMLFRPMAVHRVLKMFEGEVPYGMVLQMKVAHGRDYDDSCVAQHATVATSG